MSKSKSNENESVQHFEKKAIEEELTQVKIQNADLSSQLDKLKRVLGVMDKQLKLQKVNK